MAPAVCALGKTIIRRRDGVHELLGAILVHGVSDSTDFLRPGAQFSRAQYPSGTWGEFREEGQAFVRRGMGPRHLELDRSKRLSLHQTPWTVWSFLNVIVLRGHAVNRAPRHFGRSLGVEQITAESLPEYLGVLALGEVEDAHVHVVVAIRVAARTQRQSCSTRPCGRPLALRDGRRPHSTRRPGRIKLGAAELAGGGGSLPEERTICKGRAPRGGSKAPVRHSGERGALWTPPGRETGSCKPTLSVAGGSALSSCLH